MIKGGPARRDLRLHVGGGVGGGVGIPGGRLGFYYPASCLIPNPSSISLLMAKWLPNTSKLVNVTANSIIRLL